MGIFDENHRLTHLKKCNFFDYSKMTFLTSKQPSFEKTTSSNDNAMVSLTEKRRLERYLEILN